MRNTKSLERVSLSPNGPVLSRLVWGSMRSLEQFSSPTELASFLAFLLDHGITSLDTADIYGNYAVEEFLGKALSELGSQRSQFEIITKAGIAISKPGGPHRIKHYNSTAAHIRHQAETSLRKLGVEILDVLLVHRPDHLMDADDTAAALDTLVAEGKVRHVGVSNFGPHKWRLLSSRMKAPLVTNQIQLSPIYLDTLSDGSLDLAQELRIRPMIWSPVGGGKLLSETSTGATAARLALTAIAQRYGLAGPGESAIAWVARHPAAPLPIIGSGHRERIEGALAALATRLDYQDWYEVLLATNPALVP